MRKFIMLIAAGALASSLAVSGCSSSSSSQYADDLESGTEKYYSGNSEDMTDAERNAVDNFNQWMETRDDNGDY